jgi:acyl carrier protein
MDRIELEKIARREFSNHLSVPLEEVVDSAELEVDLGADSLDVIELVMIFEETFNIIIPDEEAEKLRTVRQALDYLEAKINEARSKDKQ